MIHGVLRILNTFWQGFVTYIYRISAILRKVRLVGDKACFLFRLRRFDAACGASCKRVVAIVQYSVALCESTSFCIFPFLGHVNLYVACRCLVIIVNDYFVFLPVPFTWREHYGTGILKHRYQIRYNNGLCEQVLRRAEKIWTLPFP